MRIFISPLFYEKMYQNQEKEFPWFCDTVCFRGRKSDGSIHRALAFTRKETINLSIYANKRTCAFLNKPPVEPPKIGDGVFGSNFGADHAGAASPSARTIWNDWFFLPKEEADLLLFVNCALELVFEDNFGEDLIANATDEVKEAILQFKVSVGISLIRVLLWGIYAQKRNKETRAFPL